LQPAAFIIAFIACWSIAVLGGYLAVAGLGNLHRHVLVGLSPAARHAHFPLQRPLFVIWDLFLLLLGGLLMTAGMVIFYTLTYG
jgi:hypothetical protein